MTITIINKYERHFLKFKSSYTQIGANGKLYLFIGVGYIEVCNAATAEQLKMMIEKKMIKAEFGEQAKYSDLYKVILT